MDGARFTKLAVASFASSNVASAGVLGANEVWNELVSVFILASSLPAKRTLIERVLDGSL